MRVWAARTSPLPLWPALALNAGFACTGFLTVLLGCLLPSISFYWRANDGHAGRLLAAQFAGSALGALLPGANLKRSALRGYLLVIVAALALAVAGQRAGMTLLLQCILFFFFGTGLGWAMTSTSLLVGSLFRHARGAALSLLNAFWTMGAAICPFAATTWTRHFSAAAIFFPVSLLMSVCLAAIFLSFRLSTGLSARQNAAMHPDATPEADAAGSAALILLAAIAFLYVGVESSVSGWMITFVHRDLQHPGYTWAPLAASSFWVAVLSGRLLAPLLLRRLSEERLLGLSLLAATAGLGFLIASNSPLRIIAAAWLCGLALGPVFPLCIARCLELNSDSPRVRYIFALSGFGGAVLPWLTGLLSSRSHSLRQGLLMPLLALCVILALTAALARLSNRAENLSSGLPHPRRPAA